MQNGTGPEGFYKELGRLQRSLEHAQKARRYTRIGLAVGLGAVISLSYSVYNKLQIDRDSTPEVAMIYETEDRMAALRDSLGFDISFDVESRMTSDLESLEARVDSLGNIAEVSEQVADNDSHEYRANSALGLGWTLLTLQWGALYFNRKERKKVEELLEN